MSHPAALCTHPGEADEIGRRRAGGCIEQAQRTAEIMHVFQPIWEIEHGTLVGFEALARFADETPPDVVWRAAEVSGMSLELDRISIRSALHQATGLPGRIFVNVSAPNIGTACSPRGSILRAMQACRGGPARVVLEVTESPYAHPDQLCRDVRRIRGLGAALALDDAGECAATLDRLSLLKPWLGYVKLAPRMIHAWLDGGESELPRWLAAMRSRGLKAIAEGVEDRDAARHILHAGIRYVQGYAFGMPEPAVAWGRDRLAELRPHGRHGVAR